MPNYTPYETILNPARIGSNSVKTTIPIAITTKLNLEKGDTITWDIDKVNDEWIAILKKKNQ